MLTNTPLAGVPAERAFEPMMGETAASDAG